MYGWGYPNYCCPGYNDGFGSNNNSWLWIVIVIFIVIFLFRESGSRGNNNCHY